MPELSDIRPAGIIVKALFTFEELKKIVKALDNTEIKVDWKKSEEVEAHNYLKDEFYPWVKNTVGMIENDFRPDR